MDLIQPIKISAELLSSNQPMTSVEMAKLWATYIGNSMSRGILKYFLQNVEEDSIKILLKNALAISDDFIKTIEKFFDKEGFPIPKGFSEEDINDGAPRLFEDQFYAHYLKYAAKAGMSIYSIAIPLVMREDIRDFFVHCNTCTTILLGQINNVLMEKGYIIKPPNIPVPMQVDFAQSQAFLKGFVGDIRPLHAMEITHLYDNIENNITSKALIMGFIQTVKDDKVRKLLLRGKDITMKSIERFQEKLQKEDLPAPSLLDHLVTTSTFAPFSDKLMLFHKVDMFSMKIRHFGNSLAVNGRRDIGLLYLKSLADVSLFIEDGANILIEHGWMEQPPRAVDRDHLSKE